MRGLACVMKENSMDSLLNSQRNMYASLKFLIYDAIAIKTSAPDEN